MPCFSSVPHLDLKTLKKKMARAWVGHWGKINPGIPCRVLAVLFLKLAKFVGTVYCLAFVNGKLQALQWGCICVVVVGGDAQNSSQPY